MAETSNDALARSDFFAKGTITMGLLDDFLPNGRAVYGGDTPPADSFAARFQPVLDAPLADLNPPRNPPLPRPRPLQAPSGEGTGPIDGIVRAESGGNPNATNPNSTATGAGQFIESTWLDMLRRHRPDLVDGRSRQELLALRTDPVLSRQMTEAYAADNGAILKNAGLPVTPGTLYLAHFAGPKGAVKVLSADPSTPAGAILGQGAVDANRAMALGRMTAGDLRAWAERRVSGTRAPAARPVMPPAPAVAPAPPAAAPAPHASQLPVPFAMAGPQVASGPQPGSMLPRFGTAAVALRPSIQPPPQPNLTDDVANRWR